MITAKKRFEIFKRDGFRCVYCGKTWKDVTLEVDHIVAKTDWGSDEFDNLVTCCRECNMWKWKTSLEQKDWYKYVINKYVRLAKSDFYNEWNKRGLGTIDEKTTRLLSLVFKLTIWEDNYEDFLIDDWTYDNKQLEAMFKTWGEYCERVMAELKDVISYEVNAIIEDCANDDIWNWDNKDNLSLRLNYKLSELCYDYQIGDHYLIKKHSLFPNLLNND